MNSAGRFCELVERRIDDAEDAGFQLVVDDGRDQKAEITKKMSTPTNPP